MLDFVVYPGTFDPVTYGHIDVVERSLRLYHRVLIAVAESQSKQPLFTTEERIRLIHQAVGHLSGVSIERFDGLLVDYLRHKGASAVIRDCGQPRISNMNFRWPWRIASCPKNSRPFS